ncbi:20S proteasome subunit alpha 1 [Nematocida sp. AWRm77]|nr:20S proteasome subunit alpha 1 [Nematocida sp. AWRm77]
MSEDRTDNAFSEEGTLFQVEYALEGAKKGMPCSVVAGKEKIAMAASKRVPEKLMDSEYLSSFFDILPGLAGVVSGYPADVQSAAMLVKKTAVSLRNELGKSPTPDVLARVIADKWQVFTQENSRRLLAINLAVIGYCSKGFPSIYYTDSSGVLFPYKAVSFGEGGAVMMKKLEKVYSPDTAETEAVETALLSLSEALGPDYLATNIEVGVLSPTSKIRRMSTDEIDTLLVRIAEKE